MTPEQLPSTFCWTKMGAESGEDLSEIILRKEWERRLGGGRFLWGIGQSLGENANKATLGGNVLTAVFSPMRSKPKEIDVTPSDVNLWNSWVDASGQVHPLPSHAFVTSRAQLPSGRRKQFHYALVCNSSTELGITNKLRVLPKSMRNLCTGKAIGSSQVTAIVEYSRKERASTSEGYPVSFIVQLDSPFFIKLVNPSLLCRNDLELTTEVVRSGDMLAWASLVSTLRSSHEVHMPYSHSNDMFQSTFPLCDWNIDRLS